MAITPTGISWLDQWILSQGGTLAGQDTDVPPVTSPQPTYESSRRFLKRYISGDSEGYDDYDSNLTGGYAPDIGIGESFQSLITSAAGLFDKFDVGSIVDVGEGAKGLFSGGLEGLIEGVKLDFNDFIATEFDPLNNPSPTNMGYLGNMVRAYQDPGVSAGRRFGATMVGLGGTLLGAAIPGVGLLGNIASALNYMGAHHAYDPSVDSNLSLDLSTGRFEWDSQAPGGGGMQWGPLSTMNMAEYMANLNPWSSTKVTTPEGEEKYIANVDLPEAAARMFAITDEDVDAMGLTSFDDLYSNPTVDMQMNMDFPGMTNADALSSLSNMYGNAWNSLAADNPNLGYNQLATLASQKASELGDFIDSGGYYDSGPYGGVTGGLSMDDAMAAAMEEAGPTGTVDSGSEGSSAESSNNDGNDWGGIDGYL